MDTTMWAAVVGLVSGAVGYWFTTFWMKPVLQYRELRSRVFADLIFYAQVVNAEGLNDRMQCLLEDRVVANRRTSADLAACTQELPGWYRWWLRTKGHSPEDASRHLIGFSNTYEYDAAAKRVAAIRRALGFKQEDE